ncbi:MAG: T9SS type A sorting domain-containing protein, partial [Flavobacteriales bacterium]
GQGYLRMIVNPFSTPGSGMLHFLIYPTGEPLNYTDAYYYLQTTVLNTENASPEVESAIVRANEIMYAGPTQGQILLFDYSGKCVSVSALNTVTQSISIESLPAGIYLLKAPTGNTFRILKPY